MVTNLLASCPSFVPSFRAVGTGGFEAFLDIITQIVWRFLVSMICRKASCPLWLVARKYCFVMESYFSNPCWVKLTMLPCSRLTWYDLPLRVYREWRLSGIHTLVNFQTHSHAWSNLVISSGVRSDSGLDNGQLIFNNSVHTTIGSCRHQWENMYVLQNF